MDREAESWFQPTGDDPVEDADDLDNEEEEVELDMDEWLLLV